VDKIRGDEQQEPKAIGYPKRDSESIGDEKRDKEG
jgi:hypothetical protein